MDAEFLPAMALAYQGDVSGFEACIRDHPELVTQRSSCSHPTLLQFIAVESGLGKIEAPERFARLLIEAGAPTDEALLAAASTDSRSVIAALLAAGASIESCAPWTALEEAIYWGHQGLPELLIATYNASVTSLRVAAGMGELTALETHADRDCQSGEVLFPWGREPADETGVLNQAFVIAIRNRQTRTAGWLVQRGAKVSAIPPGYHERCSALHHACAKNEEPMVHWLLDHGANLNLRDPRFDSTPIGWAEHAGHHELAAKLKSR